MTASTPSNNNNGDFPHLDPAVSIALPNVDVSSSDLFGGDLFGDELIDMYSSATTVSGSSNSGGLLSSTPSVPSGEVDKSTSNVAVTTSEVLSSDVPVIASNNSPADDGLGAFRPSTSFNNLHVLATTPTSTSGPTTSADVIPASPVVETGAQVVDPCQQHHQQVCAPNLSAKRGIQAITGGEQATDTNMKTMVPKLKMRKVGRKSSGVVVPASMLPQGKGVQLHQINKPHPVSVSPTPSSIPTPNEDASCTPNPLGTGSIAVDNSNSSSVTRIVSLERLSDCKSSNHNHGSNSNTFTPINNQDIVIAPDQVTSNNNDNNTSYLPPSSTQASATATAAAVAAAASATATAPTPTAADFTAVAQAAVSNLILSAGVSAAHQAAAAMVTSSNTTKNDASNNNTNNNVDSTSTARVNALTSVNWVTSMNHNTNTATNIPIHSNSKTTASSSNAVAKLNHENHTANASAAAVAAAAAAASAVANVANNKQRCNNRGSRQNLTPDERAKQNRDRNREHARNTRLRKKAYVEELKRTLTEMVAERDAADLQRRQDQQRELEQREVRFRVMQEFLLMRGLNDGQKERWEAIMEDGFELSLPATSMYREMKSDSCNSGSPISNEDDKAKDCGEGIPFSKPVRQVTIDAPSTTSSNCSVFSLQENTFHGAEEVMKDSASLAHCLEQAYGGEKVYLSYHCDRNRFLMDGCIGIMDWMATTESTTPNKATFTKLHFKGTMKATFSPASNKIIKATLFFDTGAVFQQLQRLTTDLPTSMITVASNNSNTPEEPHEQEDAAAEADAILETLQMPFFPGSTSTNISVEVDNDALHNQPASVTSSERSDSESESDNLVDMILS